MEIKFMMKKVEVSIAEVSIFENKANEAYQDREDQISLRVYYQHMLLKLIRDIGMFNHEEEDLKQFVTVNEYDSNLDN